MQLFNLNLIYDDPQKLINIFFDIAEHQEECRRLIETKFLFLDPRHDTRVLSFVLLRESTNNAILSAIYLKEHLSNPLWWKGNKHFNIGINTSASYISDRTYSYGVYLTSSYLILSFSQIETALRNIIKNLNPEFNIKNPSKFSKIRDYLIDTTKIDQDYKNLFAIFQNIRNSMHNGGFHSIESSYITYRNKSFEFIQGEPIRFDVWETIKLLLIESDNFLMDLFSTQIISEIKNIIHPYANITFAKTYL